MVVAEDDAQNSGRRDFPNLGPSRGPASPDQLPATKMSTLKAAILIVSTTASKDPSADSSGGILKDVFEQEGGGKWEVIETKIVGDEVLDIQRSIMSWADPEDAVNLIVSTGGTGFAVHDSTPEVRLLDLYYEKRILINMKAVTPLLHKQASGLVHGMLATSLEVTPCKIQPTD